MSPICDPWVKAGTAKTYTWEVCDYGGEQFPHQPSPLLTKREAIAWMRIGEAAFLREVVLGNLNVKRVGRQTLVHRSELERWAKGNK